MNQKKIPHLFKRCILLCAGLITMAFGVAFSIKAALGTSPISSLPYVTGCVSNVSVGTTTIIMNCAFVLIQIIILRNRYQWVQLLQIPAAILFGTMIDVGEYAIQNLSYSTYLEQWLWCIVGIILVGVGVSMEVTAKLVTTAGEGVILAICQVIPIKFGNMKVIFDVTLVCLSIIISLLFLRNITGVREGTIAAAVCVGLITKQFNKPMKYFEKKFLSDSLEPVPAK